MLKLIHQQLRGVFKIKQFDLAIIGAGPVGLFAANYAHLHNLKTVIFDSMEEIGGQPKMLYPFKDITDIPVFNHITADELIERLTSELTEKAKIETNHRVNEIEKNEDSFIIDNEYLVKSIIIATGAGAFKPKKFPVKIAPEAEKRVHYFFKDPESFAGQTIGVFGGGDSALDWAQELAKEANVILVHRRSEFRGMQSSVENLRSLKNVEILTPYLPKTAELVDNKLKLGLKKMASSEIEYHEFDQIVVAYGFRADNRFVKKWGIELNGAGINVSRTMETNISGIYAIGDIATYEGRVPVIGVGFGEAQIAITDIMRRLFPEKTLTIHSTSM